MSTHDENTRIRINLGLRCPYRLGGMRHMFKYISTYTCLYVDARASVFEYARVRAYHLKQQQLLQVIAII